MKKPKLDSQSRLMSLEAPAEDSRVVSAALSSMEPVPRSFGIEVLEHTERAINLERASDGLPLLINHDRGALPIGRVKNIRVQDDRLRGDLHFSEATQEARDAWGLVQDGTLGDVSISYTIDKYDAPKRKGDPHLVTRWTPFEVSAVSVPADSTVGIGRQLEESTDMSEEKDEGTATVPTKSKPSASRKAGMQEGAELERARISGIEDLAANFPDNAAIADLALEAKRDGWTENDFKDRMIEAMSPAVTPSSHPTPHARFSPSIVPGESGGEKFERGILEALNLRAGNIDDDKRRDVEATNEFTGYSIVELGRKYLELGGVSTRGMSPTDVAGAMLTRYIDPGTANLTTANFPAILENVLNKSLFRGFEQAPVTWNIWAGTGSSRDFKPGTRPGVSQFTSLEVVNENAQIQDGIVTDKKEGFQVQTWARKFSITRQTIVNDDLSGLADVASKMGMAAGRTVDEQVYVFVEANGNMTETTRPLFNATDNNLVTGAGDPSTDNVGTARIRMGKQTDWNGIILGIVPQYMVCPIELEQKMLEISTLNADPTRIRRDNVYRTMWQPVATPRLTDANDWYMFGNTGEHIDVIFLNGTQAPMMARDEGWSVLAAHWRVVLDFTVMAVDFRSGIKFTNADT